MNQFELTYANQQDAFSLLYYHLSHALCQRFPAEGEQVVCTALDDMGAQLGTQLRQLHLDQELNTNLTVLFNPGYGISRDPRVWDCDQEWYEESRIWDVFACPLAQLWTDLGEDAAHLGALYCRRFYPALVSAYTQGLGTAEAEQCMTCGDDCCHLTAFLPSANMDGQQKWGCFGRKDGPEDKDFEPTDFSVYIGTQMLSFTQALLHRARQAFSTQGEEALSAGLDAFSAALSDGQRRDLPLPDGEETFWPDQELEQLFLSRLS